MATKITAPFDTGTTSNRIATSPSAPTDNVNNYGAFAENPLYKYNTLSKQAVGGNTSLTGGVQKPPTKVAQYDATGKLLGYLVTTFNADGSANTPTFESYTTPLATTTPGQTGQGAFDIFKARFAAAGLGSLADSLISLSKSENAPQTSEGYYLALLDTPTYKERFGNTNALRIKNGLPALAEGDILTAETNIKKTLQAYGLPEGFYDQPSDFQQFIGSGKSANEIGDTVAAYQTLAKQRDPQAIKDLENYYGIGLGEITAHLLDPAKAQPILNTIAQKGTSVIAAKTAGLDTGAAQLANQYGVNALDFTKQAQAYAKSQELAQQAGTLANIYGGNYNLEQGLQESLNAPTAMQAQQERERLSRLETSAFSGSAGASKGSLGVEETGIL